MQNNATGRRSSRPFSKARSSSRNNNSRPSHSSRNTRQGGGFRNSSSRPHAGRFGNARRSGRKMPTFNPSQFINTNPVDVVEEVYTAKNTFATFGLSATLTQNIAALNMVTPSPIQDQIIPEILAGHDVVGLAETGTGKTAAFLLPLIEKTHNEHGRTTLILAPTRELAIQIENEFKNLSRGLRMSSVVCVGGINIRPQIRALSRHNNFIIGTPGRVLDLINRTNIHTEEISTVVLDEADRMLDMGFIGDIKKILQNTPKTRETLFFSATMDDRTKQLVHEFLNDPVTISVKKKDVTNSIAQDVVPYADATKFETLRALFEDPEFKRVIIFGAMKHSVKRLAEQLSQSGVYAEAINGNKSHAQRQRALNKFKSGNARVLVATDVAARGIHVDNVSHVINYDLPNTFEDYVHRIGRTGRGDKRGKALTFVPQR